MLARNPQGGLLVGVVLIVLEVILVVLTPEGGSETVSEQVFGTDSVRSNVPSQHRNLGLALNPMCNLHESLWKCP